MTNSHSHGEKRAALAAAGKIRHKVALIGRRLFGNLTLDEISQSSADIHLFDVPEEYKNIESLSTYSLIILDFESFRNLNEIQQYFAKRMVQALEEGGTTFCFVHYDQAVPNPGSQSLDDPQTLGLYREQIGLQALWGTQIIPFRATAAFHSGKVIRNEFKRFLERWGASHIYFQPSLGYDDVIYKALHENNLVLGFVKTIARGKVIVLPFMRDFSRNDETSQAIETLIDCLLTYLIKSRSDLPDWAVSPFFGDEQSLALERNGLQAALQNIEKQLNVFEAAKSILFQDEYTLESSVPQFLADAIGLHIEREERFKEDFWVLDDEKRRVAIAEVKSLIKGFRKGTIYSVLSHRDEYGLGDNFPALLFVNSNLQAGSWADKDRGIDINDCSFAAENNVLIIRVEDLVRLWDSIRTQKLDSQRVSDLLLNTRGWLHVTSDLNIQPKP